MTSCWTGTMLQPQGKQGSGLRRVLRLVMAGSLPTRLCSLPGSLECTLSAGCSCEQLQHMQAQARSGRSLGGCGQLVHEHKLQQQKRGHGSKGMQAGTKRSALAREAAANTLMTGSEGRKRAHEALPGPQ